MELLQILHLLNYFHVGKSSVTTVYLQHVDSISWTCFDFHFTIDSETVVNIFLEKNLQMCDDSKNGRELEAFNALQVSNVTSKKYTTDLTLK